MIGDGPFGSDNAAGVEELSTIAILQNLYSLSRNSRRPQAKLVEVPGVNWNTSSLDRARRAAHDETMKSKIARPALQLKTLEISPPAVHHI